MAKRRKFPVLLTLLMMLFSVSVEGYETPRGPLKQAPSFEVITHLVVGTNNAVERQKENQKLSRALKNVASDFGYEHYVPQITHFQTVGTGGNIASTSITRSLGSLVALEKPIISRWSFSQFHVDSESPGSVGIKAFQFDARFPYRFTTQSPEPRVRTDRVMIKLAVSNLEVAMGRPVLIGSLPLPEHEETLFIILDIKQQDF